MEHKKNFKSWRIAPFALVLALASGLLAGERTGCDAAPPTGGTEIVIPSQVKAEAVRHGDVLVSPALTPTFGSRVTSGCVLSVAVLDEPQLSGDFTVDAAGLVHFRLTDDAGGNVQTWYVSVVGQTVEGAQNVIAFSLKKYLRAPRVNVSIRELPALRVELTGAARNACLLDLPVGARLTDALTLAEANADADLTNVRILRRVVTAPVSSPAAPAPGANTSSDPRTANSAVRSGLPAVPVRKSRPAMTEAHSALSGEPEDGATRKTILVNVLAFNRGLSDEDPVLEAGDRILLVARPGLKPLPPKPVPQFVHVHGEVTHEADVPLSSGLTVKEALERVGGATVGAEHGKIHLVRTKGNYLALEMDKVEANDPDANLPLAPDDLLLVFPAAPAQHFAVIGEAALPNTYVFEPGKKMTIATALLAAGGPTQKADLHKCVLAQGYLINPTQTRNLPFDLELVAKGKQPNMEVQPGDAIILPPKQHKPSFWQKVLPFALRFLPLPF